MNTLRFSAGTGRLLRSQTAVVFAETSNDELFALFSDDSPVDFKELAALIVSKDFALGPFVVIALDEPRVFVFGDLNVHAGGEVLSGASTSTWFDRELDAEVGVTTGELGETSGELTLGWVSAAGFAFGGSRSTEHRQADNQGEANLPSTAAELPLAVQVATNPAPPPSSDQTPAPASNGKPADDWDPLADPDVDLESIGSQEYVDVAVPEPPSITHVAEANEVQEVRAEDLFVPEDTRDSSKPPPQAATPPSDLSIPPPPAPVGLKMNDSAFTDSGERPPIPPPPGSPSAEVAKSSPTIPAPVDFGSPTPSDSGAIVRFDDGQSRHVAVGLYVGRHPTKNGLPDNYTSVTIRGEHVSRVHFDLVIGNGRAIVRDLGSNSGTEIEMNGRRQPVPRDGMQISPGAKILFADRWAIYEVE